MLVELRATGGASLDPFEPGAHLEIYLPNGLIRHYSLINDSRERDRYVVGVGRASHGRGGSEWIHRSLRCGAELAASHPRNNFALDTSAESYLFIAGGIGITPIMTMIRWCSARARPWRLIYAARSCQRAAFYETLREYGDRVHCHFDDQTETLLDVRQWLEEPLDGQHVYCCGPGLLMQAVREHSSHLPAETVHFEYFAVPTVAARESVAPDIVSTAGTSDVFQVNLRRSGLSFPVALNQSILEVLEAGGVSVPFSCREGLCGTCETTVCEGEVEHNDYVLSQEQRAANKSMMICVSRSRSPTLVLDL